MSVQVSFDQSFWAGGHARGTEIARIGECQWLEVGKTHFAEALGVNNRLPMEPVALFADTELGNNGLIPFRVVLLQVVEQATPLADQHEKPAARAMVFLVRFEVVR